MKSARERAQDVYASLPGTAQLAIKYDGLGVDVDAWTTKVEMIFNDHARGQRTCCAAEVHGLDLGVACSDEAWTIRDECRKRALAAPAPGEKQ